MFPPSFNFIRHFLCRMIEITNRIGLISILWIVANNNNKPVWFVAFYSYELFLIYLYFMSECLQNDRIDWTSLFLRLGSITVLPPETIFARYDLVLSCCIFQLFYGCFGCGYLGYKFAGYHVRQKGFLSTMGARYIYFDIRVGMTCLEWIIVAVVTLYNYITDKTIYIDSIDQSFVVLIVSISCFLLYTQFIRLMPNFAMLNNVPMRSLHCHSFLGNFDDLERISNENTNTVQMVLIGIKNILV